MKHIVCSLLALIALQLPLAASDFDPARKLRFAEQVVETFYVDSVPAGEMVDKAIVAMLKALDPHSTYSDPKETRELTEPLQGNFSGIGIQFKMLNDTIYVVQTIAGGPSEKVGIVPGDRILSANDTALAGVKMVNTDVMKHLRGPKGSTVELKVKRKNAAQPITFRIVRDDIPLYSLDASYMAAPGVGYIKLSRFAESTPDEVRDALKQLSRQGMRDLVIDLRDNGGGYLNSAVDLAEMFLPKGSPVVYTEGLRVPTSTYSTPRDGSYTDGRLVVMVNQYSASASEILAGAIQDNDRGVVVGRRSFGKGLVQRPFPFPDGSMIRLTVARYHTPSGRCIQKPYTPGDDDEYSLDIKRRYDGGELMSADSIHFADSLQYRTLRLGRTVYGGGGIMPDRFVGIDTTGFTDFSRDVVAKGVLATFATSYIDRERKELKRQYPTVEKFAENFVVTPALMAEFVEAAEKEGIKADPKQVELSSDYLRTALKGLIASDVYDRGAYYRVANALDPIYTEAIGLLKPGGDYDATLRSTKRD